jgi:hypothetical protein
MIRALFGARAQLTVGCLLVGLTLTEWTYWTIVGITKDAIFHVSMEALMFAAYAIIATALGIRKTEHVQAQVAKVEADQADVSADEVEVES